MLHCLLGALKRAPQDLSDGVSFGGRGVGGGFVRAAIKVTLKARAMTSAHKSLGSMAQLHEGEPAVLNFDYAVFGFHSRFRLTSPRIRRVSRRLGFCGTKPCPQKSTNAPTLAVQSKDLKMEAPEEDSPMTKKQLRDAVPKRIKALSFGIL